MQSLLTFLFVLSVLVVVHEFGHFIVARLVGIRVEKFSIGFGPVIFGKKFAGTEFCFSVLPLGGFVKMAGENPNEAAGHPWEFNSKSLLEKFAVVFAGPFMNAALAFFIFFLIFCWGQPMLTTRIGKVLDDAPAKTAGILEGDKVIAVNGERVVYWEDLLKEVHKKNDSIVFTVERDGKSRDFTLTPKIMEVNNWLGKKVKSAFVGVAPSNEMIYVKSSIGKAWGLAWERLWALTSLIFVSLGLMITGVLPFKDSMTGPIGIFFMTRQAAQMGAPYLFYFMGSLSVSLFVLNLLPIPVLDGGHILFVVIERLKGSPLRESVKEKMTQGGVVVLLALMAFVILQDVHRFSIIQNIRQWILPR